MRRSTSGRCLMLPLGAPLPGSLPAQTPPRRHWQTPRGLPHAPPKRQGCCLPCLRSIPPPKKKKAMKEQTLGWCCQPHQRPPRRKREELSSTRTVGNRDSKRPAANPARTRTQVRRSPVNTQLGWARGKPPSHSPELLWVNTAPPRGASWCPPSPSSTHARMGQLSSQASSGGGHQGLTFVA
jgi:hypothetical protein